MTSVVLALQERQLPFAVVGGYAVNLHGFVRSTIDLDLLLPLEKQAYVAAEECMHRLGLECRVPVTAEQLFSDLDFYREKKNMKVWSFFNPKKPWDIVDFLLTHDLRQFNIIIKELENVKIPVIDLAGLIVLKKAAGRAQDLEDLRALENSRKKQ